MYKLHKQIPDFDTYLLLSGGLDLRRSARCSLHSARRPLLFYLLLPFMVAYARVSIPIGLVLSLGDMVEEPNNHLVVARKPA
jgi:hypothetical protein